MPAAPAGQTGLATEGFRQKGLLAEALAVGLQGLAPKIVNFYPVALNTAPRHFNAHQMGIFGTLGAPKSDLNSRALLFTFRAACGK